MNEQTPINQRCPLEHFHDEFKNYRSAELDEDATTALEGLVESGFVRCFRSEADAIAYLRGATPVSSKLALVKNTKDGVTKCRLILDRRVSGSNDAATKVERVLLPKCWDVLRDIMALGQTCNHGEKVKLFVLDFRDAFYMLPLLAAEQKYIIAYINGKWYIWTRVAQGSLNGPNAFGRLSALTGRMTRAMMSSTRSLVDVKRYIAVMTLLWLALGWGLSSHQRPLGTAGGLDRV